MKITIIDKWDIILLLIALFFGTLISFDGSENNFLKSLLSILSGIILVYEGIKLFIVNEIRYRKWLSKLGKNNFWEIIKMIIKKEV